jgi:hypothetical protein
MALPTSHVSFGPRIVPRGIDGPLQSWQARSGSTSFRRGATNGGFSVNTNGSSWL